eukprot:6349251-Pyramimonas_sp.AAC.1
MTRTSRRAEAHHRTAWPCLFSSRSNTAAGIAMSSRLRSAPHSHTPTNALSSSTSTQGVSMIHVSAASRQLALPPASFTRGG